MAAACSMAWFTTKYQTCIFILKTSHLGSAKQKNNLKRGSLYATINVFQEVHTVGEVSTILFP
jgi:hypothetical protein